MIWQPIETAPKDETEFLGCWANGDMHVVYLRADGECRRAMDDEKWMVPGYWMQLPNDPYEPRYELTDAGREALGGGE